MGQTFTASTKSSLVVHYKFQNGIYNFKDTDAALAAARVASPGKRITKDPFDSEFIPAGGNWTLPNDAVVVDTHG